MNKLPSQHSFSRVQIPLQNPQTCARQRTQNLEHLKLKTNQVFHYLEYIGD
jgi:hypothetical protein